MFDLTGRISLVVGGTRNIGLHTALALAKAGSAVAVVGRDPGQLETASAALKAADCEHHAMLADSRDPAAIRAAVEETEAALGPIDILVNNAAIRPTSSWRDITPEDFDDVFAVNLRAPFLYAQAVLGGMIERGHGRIISMSGIDAFWGKVGRVHVTSTKGAIIGMTRALAHEGGPNVTVNAVVPGTIDTERHTPEWYPHLEEMYAKRLERTVAGRLGKPEEVAAAVVYLASDEAAYVTGQSLLVTGGAFPLVKC